MNRRHTSTVACLSAAFFLAAVSALANPQGGTVSNGQATISQNGSTLNVNQSSDRALINWMGFNIAAGETTNFIQPSSSSITVNRVNSNAASQINGALNANGNVVIINQNGVLFGGGAKVDVNGLVATTSDINPQQFMAGGNLQLTTPGNPTASIINNGQITAHQAGLVGFVAPNVINNGIITARLGKVQLASGDTATIDMYGDHLMEVAVSDQVKSQLVSNTGRIEADGGTIALTAASGGAIVNSLINVAGELNAPAVAHKGGTITIYAEGSNAVTDNVTSQKNLKQGTSTVLVSGSLNAGGKGQGQTGGTVIVTGDNVALLTGSFIDVSGYAGGGTVQAGGDFHGAGVTPTAIHTILETGSTIDADALFLGTGGNVTLWSDQWTNFAGFISARGGAQGGNGGYIETSGHQQLFSTGLVDASAALGRAGTWLLDPNNITIQAAGSDTNVTGNPTFTTTDDSAIVTTGSIEAALNAGTSVTITTSSNGNNSQLGNITVADNILKSSGGDATLSLVAVANIIVNDNVFIESTTGKLNIVFDAYSQGTGSGHISLGNGAELLSNGGNITLGGGSNPTTGFAVDNTQNCCGGNAGILLTSATTTVDAGGGNIIMNGQATGQYDNNSGIFSYGLIQTSGSGNITLSGIGGVSQSGNYDIFLDGPNSGAGLSAASPSHITLNSLGAETRANGLYLNNSNSSSNGGSLEYYDVIGWNTTLDANLWLGSVLKQTGGDETWQISAPGYIDFLANAVVQSTSGKLNLIVDADAGASSNGGHILLGAGAELLSNGGNITLGGGTNPATGFAVDNTQFCCGNNAGILLSASNTIVNAGGGNIVMNGKATGQFDSNSGIVSNGIIETSGAGTITLTGIGGVSQAGNFDIYLNGPNSSAGLVAAAPSDVTLNSLGTETRANGLFLNNSNGSANGGSLDYYNVIGWNTTIDANLWLGSVLKQTGGDATWQISAPGYIDFINGAVIQSTSGKLNLIVDADSGASTDGGHISLGSGAELISNGGNITLGGGTNPVTGFAVDNTQFCCGGNAGILLSASNTIINAGGGNIVMNGKATGQFDNNSGIASNGLIETSGSGTITLTGIGGVSQAGNFDIYLNGPNSSAGLVAAALSDITLNSLGTETRANGLFLNNSNGSANGGSLDYYNVIGWNTTIDANLWLGSVLKQTGGDETWQISAPGYIDFLNGAIIQSTSGKLNLIVDADAGGSTNGGHILLGSGADLISNGGDITLGGGTNPATGFAVDNTQFCCGGNAGILLSASNTIVNAGGGNIVMNGKATGQYDNNSGIVSNGIIETSGAGTITLTGIGGVSQAGNFDIYLNGPNSSAGLIAASPSNITLNSLGTETRANGLFLNNSNGSSNGGSLDYYNVIGWNTTIDANLWLGSVLKQSGGDATWQISAPGYIDFLNGAVIQSTSGKLNLIVDADSDGSINGGHISLGSGAELISNGGNITLGGGTNPMTGFAVDNTQFCCGGNAGILLSASNTIINAGGGNIVMNGKATGQYDNNSGIMSNGIIETSGTGTIALVGDGGLSNNAGNYDIFLNGGAAITTTGSGAISLTGLGVTNDNGISSSSGSHLIGSATDTGDISIVDDHFGFSGITVETFGNVSFAQNSSGTSIGVAGGSGTLSITQSLLSSTSAGSITIGNALSGAMTVDANSWNEPVTLINGSGAMTIAGAQQLSSHSLTLETNDLSLGADLESSGTGILTIASSADTTPFHINDGVTTDLFLDASALGHISSNFASAVFGSSQDTGNMTIGATSWAFPVAFHTGSGNIEFEGPQSLGTHSLFASTSSGNIVIDQDSAITSTAASGNSIVLAAGANFINNDSDDGAATLAPGSGTARFLVYSNDPTLDTFNGLDGVASRLLNKTYANDAPSTITETGNVFLYGLAPTIYVTATDVSRYYGSANPVFTYTFSGFIDGDTASIISGMPSLSTAANQFTGIGNYAIALNLNSLANSMGYQMASQNGILTITPAHLTVTATNQTLTFGMQDPYLSYLYSGLVAGDTTANFTGSLARALGSNPGLYAISENTLATSGNYVISTFNPGVFTINAVPAAAPSPPLVTPLPAATLATIQNAVNAVVQQAANIHIAPITTPIIVAAPTTSVASTSSSTSASSSSSNGGSLSPGSTTTSSAGSSSSTENDSPSTSASSGGSTVVTNFVNAGSQDTTSTAGMSDAQTGQKPTFNILDLSSTTRASAPSVVWQSKQDLHFNIPTVCYTVNNLYITCTRQKTG